MLISELVKQLEEIKKDEGDLPVYRSIWDGTDEDQLLDVIVRPPNKSYDGFTELPKRVFLD